MKNYDYTYVWNWDGHHPGSKAFANASTALPPIFGITLEQKWNLCDISQSLGQNLKNGKSGAHFVRCQCRFYP